MKNMKENTSALKYGGYASIMTVVVVVIAIILNLVAGQLNIKIDLTKNKLYTLSEDTISFLKDLDTDVNIYSVYAQGSEVSVITEIVDKYASYSKHIKTQVVDPYKNPQFAAKYSQGGQAVSIGSVVVDAGGVYKIITQNDLADVVTSSTGETYMQSVKLEGVLTGTMRSLITGESKTLYELTGHREIALGEEIQKEFEYGGYSLKELSLVTTTEIPEDCSLIFINSPVEDITKEELSALNSYLDNGGRLFMTLGVTLAQMPNFDSLLANYGVKSGKMVMEGSGDYVYQNNAYNIAPILSSESIITSKLVQNRTAVLMPFSLNVEILDTIRSGVNIEPLLSSSQYSYSKDIAALTESEMTENDEKGPFILGAAITDSDVLGNENGVKLIVIGGATITDGSVNSVVNGGNFGMVMNALDWLTDNEGTLRSKSLGGESYLAINQTKAIIIMAVSVILIPAAIVLLGLTVVLRRKNR